MPGNEHSLNILLVYPRYPDTFWSFRHALKFVSKKAFTPPLGLLTVAALLPKTWNLRLVDLNVDSLKEGDIRWADRVFLSAMDVQQASVREMIPRITSQGKKILAGGPLFTMSPGRFKEVDHVVLGEAEAILASVIEDLASGEAKPIYTTTELPDITTSPVPQWNLLDISKYASMSVQHGRGCPFECDFCAVSLLNGKRPRLKKEEQVLAELEALYRAGWRGAVFFVDDHFNINPRELKDGFLPALIRWMEKRGYPFFFYTQASVNLADDEELLRLMVQAGFDSVFLGIESPQEDSLRECHKVFNLRSDIMAAVKKIQRLGLQVTGGFVVGFDSDRPSIFQKQIDFIQQSGIVTAMTGMLNAERGTRLYKRLEEEHRLIEDTSGDNTNFLINFIPKMGYQPLVEGYTKMVRFIYSPEHFYQRLITFLKNYNPPKRRAGRAFRLCDIKALFHSIWSLGIWGKERFCYWKVFLWTLLRRRALLLDFLRLAIYGHHFRKVFENGDSAHFLAELNTNTSENRDSAHFSG